MNEILEIGPAMLITGNCLEVMAAMPDNSVDSIVCDPPYGLKFMGKKWDYDVPEVAIWREAFRVLKPGGHLLAFAGTRTQHRMAVNIEDAEFEIRDMIGWIYGSGFPKSLDVSKAIDKAAGAEREVIGPSKRHVSGKPEQRTAGLIGSSTFEESIGMGSTITAPSTDAAHQWQGWGTALKPALEPITVARKPLIGTVAENVQTHGTGALNIDGCRVETAESITNHSRSAETAVSKGKFGDSCQQETHQTTGQALGRWPANLIHDGSDEVLECFPAAPGQLAPSVEDGEPQGNSVYSAMNRGGPHHTPRVEQDKSAARFFYCAKTSKSERNAGCDDLPDSVLARSDQAQAEAARGNTVITEGGAYNKARVVKNNHPTVKPIALMCYLCRLVTPPDGLILDPFMGSGSTGIAALQEGFKFVGIELNPQYVAIAERRITAAASFK